VVYLTEYYHRSSIIGRPRPTRAVAPWEKKRAIFGDAEENKDMLLLGQGAIRSTPE
jgi:hypothetical protein